jgi:cellulase
MPWGENILHQMPSYYRVTIPAGLQNGQYILRHEVSERHDCPRPHIVHARRNVQILGLHVASTIMGAQFVSARPFVS